VRVAFLSSRFFFLLPRLPHPSAAPPNSLETIGVFFFSFSFPLAHTHTHRHLLGIFFMHGAAQHQWQQVVLSALLFLFSTNGVAATNVSYPSFLFVCPSPTNGAQGTRFLPSLGCGSRTLLYAHTHTRTCSLLENFLFKKTMTILPDTGVFIVVSVFLCVWRTVSNCTNSNSNESQFRTFDSPLRQRSGGSRCFFLAQCDSWDDSRLLPCRVGKESVALW
jgi:hypothetical protein